VTPAEPGVTFLYGRKGPTGRIAASFCPSGVQEIGAGPACAGTHAGHTECEMALRSKPEGKILLLARLVRCRKASGPTADDAVLTLRSLFLWPKLAGATITDPAEFAEANASRGTGGEFS
jgi:hypothetical protein